MQSSFIYPFTNISSPSPTHPQVPVSAPTQPPASSPTQLPGSSTQPHHPLTQLPGSSTQPHHPLTQLLASSPTQPSIHPTQPSDSSPIQSPVSPRTQPPTQSPTHSASSPTQPPNSPPTQPHHPLTQLPVSPSAQPPDSSPVQLPAAEPLVSPPTQLPTQSPTQPHSPPTQLPASPPTQPPAGSHISPSTSQPVDLSNDRKSVSDLIPTFSDDDFITAPSPSPPPYSPIPKHDIVIDLDLNTKYTNEQLPPPIAAVLPSGYSYMFKTFQYIDNSTDLAFSATIFINITSEEGATKWIQDLEDYTATTYRLTRGNRKGYRVLYKSDRHCQHKRQK